MASSAAMSPSGVCGSASTVTSAPSSRSTAEVVGPIDTIVGPASDPPAAACSDRAEEPEANSA